MDMAFFTRAQRQLDDRQEAAGIEYSTLVAMLGAYQASTPTARAAALPDRCASMNGQAAAEPLVELLLAGPQWRDAADCQAGCFNRPIARRGVNGS